jgi:hypothetical protein
MSRLQALVQGRPVPKALPLGTYSILTLDRYLAPAFKDIFQSNCSFLCSLLLSSVAAHLKINIVISTRIVYIQRPFGQILTSSNKDDKLYACRRGFIKADVYKTGYMS